MSAPRVLARRLGCQNCQWRTLNHLTTLAGVSISPPVHTTPATLYKPIRPFATSHHVQDEAKAKDDWLLQIKAGTTESETLAKYAPSELVDKGADEAHSSQAITNVQDPSVPWYLQDQDPNQAEKGRFSHQQLPELPANSPERLNAIVEHLFNDVGLDDLRILDLRSMDPPPALGSNLIMVLGTARSDRHLHVSADRFCRWLRSTYKLQPYADGLIGRNELKIRLRRKAKRAKLLGSKGPLESDTDDGIRTGWVCVNVGSIEDQSPARARGGEREGIVGFGSDESGTHLVVQMMVEEKREDLDLEKLWLDALARQERRNLRDQQALEDNKSMQKEEEASQVRHSSNGYQIFTDTVSSHHIYPKTLQQPQTRRLHTSRRLTSQTIDWETRSTANSSDRNSSNAFWQPELALRMTHRAEVFRKQDRPKLPDGLERDLHALTVLPPDQATGLLCSILQDTLRAHPLEIKHDLEGSQNINADYHLMFRVWIASFAMLLEHPKYQPDAVRAIFEVLCDKLDPPLWLHRIAVDTFLPIEWSLNNGPPLDREMWELVFSSLATCRAKEYAFNDAQIFERLYLAKIYSLVDPSTGRIHSDSDFGAVDVEQLLGGIGYDDGVRPSELFHLQVLKILETAPNLEAFFAHWANIPIYSNSRTTAMYESFFHSLLSIGSPAIIRGALDEWVDAMDHETPPVAIEGNIAHMLADCLRIVDPHIEAVSRRNTDGKSLYATLWRKCQLGLRPEARS